MTKTILKWYKHYRNHGMSIVGESAKGAMRAARIRTRFDELESEGLVRLHLEPECDAYDDSYVDTWEHMSNTSRVRAKKDIALRIERNGCWILFGQYRISEDEEWEDADNIGGFIGDDWKDSGYDVDIMASALEAFDAENQANADKMAKRPTYAGVA